MTNDQLTAAAKSYLDREQHPVFRKDVEDQLKASNWSELNERFYAALSFGTGGLRGTLGGGTNRMNPYMVRSATQGLANYVNSTGPGPHSAVIAHDSRNYSDLFALEAALVLCANGIKTWLFTALRPTPELSFAVRQLKTTTGIVVTASHNPPEYNGYKVYWNDGAQVLPPHDQGIITEVGKVNGQFKTLTKEAALSQGLLVYIDEQIDGPYRAMVKSQSLRPELFRTHGKSLKVVYTPLHGTGITLLPRIMSELGLDLVPVPEQAVADGNFPTVTSPNPEEHSAMQMAIDLGTKVGAGLILGTDPDADRIGIGVPDKGSWVLLNGNQLGTLLVDYIFLTLKETNRMPAKPVFINTIVTTELHNRIAESYGATTYRVLTGFKYIGEKIRQFEAGSEGQTYVFGGEESYGFLFGTAVRDKDAISTAAVTIEMALYHASRGHSVMEALNELYARFGYFQEVLISKTFKGQAGLQTMKDFMKALRESPPQQVGGVDLTRLLDFQASTTRTADGKITRDIDLPSSDVVQFHLADGSVVTVRPSGTEPKIKFYASCSAPAGLALEAARKQVAEQVETLKKALDGWIN
ncbi:MAG: phospho-sugar mutase [Spirochaetales bacterium]